MITKVHKIIIVRHSQTISVAGQVRLIKCSDQVICIRVIESQMHFIKMAFHRVYDDLFP